MLRGIAALLLFQLLGESLVFLTRLPVPGPVVGIVLLFAALQAGRRFGHSGYPRIEAVADSMLANLGLMFVPAGVGVVALWGLVESQAAAIIAVLVLSAVFTLAITVWTFIGVRRLMARAGEKR
ncbi:CidA/LrgA family protein [Neorhizobium sp. JUb45]|uniref:CidA/LrgA family protein n=1 Tax=unclassified Neorhizobium TaxID=2629175 RepID=UPI00104C4D0F|nr:CidA/LrgA family protein [Neorhizobium sp. JUb45]TCR02168.1 putative effector of murein hydrolase LrgA (UPF0299 family) [Neorhizobium sp. JUb45]